MNIWNLSLLIGAVLAAGLSYRNPRALIWILGAALDYTVSVVYWRTGLPYAEAVAGMCDATLCLCLYFGARERWELVIYRLFQVSLAVNIFFLAGNLGIIPMVSQDTYASILELLNWLALLLIGGVGVAQWVGAPSVAARRSTGRLGRAVRSLRSPRKTRPFHQVG